MILTFLYVSEEEIRISAKSFEPEEGVAVVAKFPEDGKWYRAIIVSKCQQQEEREEQYNVLYVDYGNSRPVTLQEMLPVCEEFCELPMETVPCCLADVIPISRKLPFITCCGCSYHENLFHFPLLYIRIFNLKNNLFAQLPRKGFTTIEQYLYPIGSL